MDETIILFGPPGSGKSTVAARLAAELGWQNVGTGGILRALREGEDETGAYLRREGVFSLVTCRPLLLEALAGLPPGPVVLEGLRGEPEPVLGALGRRVRLLVELVAGKAVVQARLASRLVHPGSGRSYGLLAPPVTPGRDDVSGEALVRRAEDEEELAMFERRWASYGQHSGASRAAYPERYVQVPADGAPDHVYAAVRAAVEAAPAAVPPPPPPPPPTLPPELGGLATVASARDCYAVREAVLAAVGASKAAFPGSQPTSLMQSNVRELGRQPHLVSVKADGTRYLLLARAGRAFLLDRTMQVYELRPALVVAEEAQQLSLLDGELLAWAGRHKWLVLDALLVAGSDVRQQALPTRLHRAYTNGSILNIACAIQPYYRLDELSSLLPPNPADFPYPIDGLVFTPRDRPYRTGFTPQIMKWKPAEKSTVDFLVDRLQSGDLALLVRGKSRNNKPFLKQHSPASEAFAGFEGKIVECSWNFETQSYEPLRIRTDKADPNADWVVKGLEDVLRNPITEADLRRYSSQRH